jgi:hypothetical protein
MGSDHEAEIRASVAAHADLGPAYDDAVAEGLVERIGAEIDKRIDARLGQFGATGAPGPPGPGGHRGTSVPGAVSPGAVSPGAVSPGAVSPGAGPAGSVPPGSVPTDPAPMTPGAPPGLPGSYPPPAGYPGYQGYPGYPGYPGPLLPPGYQPGPPPSRPPEVTARNVATTITALGSMAMGVAATAIVSHAADVGGQGFIIFLIWTAIAVINIGYARRP